MKSLLVGVLLLTACGRVGFSPIDAVNPGPGDAGDAGDIGPLDSSLPDSGSADTGPFDSGLLDSGAPDTALPPPTPDPEAWLAFLQSHGQLTTATRLDEWADPGEVVSLTGIDATTFPRGSFGVGVIGGIYFEDIPNLEDVYFLTGVTTIRSDSNITGPDLVTTRGLEALTTLGETADVSIVSTTGPIRVGEISGLLDIPFAAGLLIRSDSGARFGTDVLSLQRLASAPGASCPGPGSLRFTNHGVSRLELSTVGIFGPVTLRLGPLSDLSGVAAGTTLCGLGFPDNQITDITSLGAITVIGALDLSGNPLRDITPLGSASMATQVTSLNLERTEVRDLAVLSRFTGLVTLNMNDTLVTDLSPIAALATLRTLFLSGFRMDQSQLELLAGLSLTRLQGDLPWSGQGLTSLAPLSGVTQLGTFGLTVDLSDNALASLTGLEGVRLMGTTVDLRGNPELFTVAALSSLDHLIGDGSLFVPDNLRDIRGLSQFRGESASPDTLRWSTAPAVTMKADAASALCTAIDSGAVLLSGAVKADICLP